MLFRSRSNIISASCTVAAPPDTLTTEVLIKRVLSLLIQNFLQLAYKAVVYAYNMLRFTGSSVHLRLHSKVDGES